MTPEQLETNLSELWRDLSRFGKDRMFYYRAAMIKEYDGDIFFPIRLWPKYIRRIFFQKKAPIGDKQTFTILLFFIGNGSSPERAGKWILSSHALFHCSRSQRSALKRIRQIKWIYENLDNNRNKWSYHDIDAKRILYFNNDVFKQ